MTIISQKNGKYTLTFLWKKMAKLEMCDQREKEIMSNYPTLQHLALIKSERDESFPLAQPP